jgi:hypothetical protein
MTTKKKILETDDSPQDSTSIHSSNKVPKVGVIDFTEFNNFIEFIIRRDTARSIPK